MTLTNCESKSPSVASKLAARVSWFFLATAVQGGISFVMVPVITYVLGPREFGIFALMTGVGGLLSLFGSLGTGYLYAEHFLGLSVSNRRELVSTTFWMGAVCLVPITGLVLGLWPALAGYFTALAVIPYVGASLIFVSVVACYPWSLAIEILVLEGRAQLYATIIVSQAVVSAITTVVGLYVLDWGIFAMFLGYSVGTLALLLGSMVVLQPYLEWSIKHVWIKRAARIGGAVTVANLLESLQSFLERYLLSVQAGIVQTGLYSHSQQYKNLVSLPLKAAARGIWPISLDEARLPRSEFLLTKRTWEIGYSAVAIAGIGFAIFGKELVALWTHDRFTEAYRIIALWMVFVLVQNAGKAQTAILYATGNSMRYAKLMVGSAVAGIVALFMLVPSFGSTGVLLALLLQQILLRMGVQYVARTIRRSPFQDAWVFIGCGGIILALVIVEPLSGEVYLRVLLFLALVVPFAMQLARLVLSVLHDRANRGIELPVL